MKKVSLEKGTIKVVWLGEKVDKIYSKMFDSLKEAEKFGKSKGDFLIFKLLRHKKFRDYYWEILPYGQFKLYKTLIEFYKKHKNKISLFIRKLIEFT